MKVLSFSKVRTFKKSSFCSNSERFIQKERGALEMGVMQENYTFQFHRNLSLKAVLFAMTIVLNLSGVKLNSNPDLDSFDLHFRPNENSYAIIEGDIPDLTSFSCCFWLKLAEATAVKQDMTLISYSNLKYRKAFLLSTRGLKMNIYAQDFPVSFPRIDLTDRKWHHVCIMRDHANRKMIIYFEGLRYNSTPYPIKPDNVLRGGGTLVIGAGKSKGKEGGFIQHFNGSLSAVNIWNKLLTADDVLKLYRACHLQRGNLLYWCEHVISPMLRNVSMTSPSTSCSSSYADGIFSMKPTARLGRHVITHYIVRDELTCSSHCLRDCRCKSFNIRKRPEGGFQCQLNNATHKEFPRDFLSPGKKRDSYYEMLN
ncbi:C-reactive protein-like isoform X2 [Acropora palmata]|uniref:C-reactive protein-like isoform X2 n=1 Tax=Acropora palmata TaxID=6131 RepID=UPI003DA04C78